MRRISEVADWTRIQGSSPGFVRQFETDGEKVKKLTIDQGPDVSFTLTPKP